MSFFPKQPSSRIGTTQTIAFDASAAIATAFGPRPISFAWSRTPPAATGSATACRPRPPPTRSFRPIPSICHRQSGPAALGDQGRQQRTGRGQRRHAVDHGDVVMEGVLIRPHLDSNGRDLAIEHVQDVAPILAWNRKARGEEQRAIGGATSPAFPMSSTSNGSPRSTARAICGCGCLPPNSTGSSRTSSTIPNGPICERTGRSCRPAGQRGIMTQIVDAASLQAAVTEYLARDQDSILIARIPTFIQLAEAKFNRQLFVRQMEQRATAVADTTSSEPEFIALPADFQSMRRVRLSSVTGKSCLEFRSGTQIDEYRFRTPTWRRSPVTSRCSAVRSNWHRRQTRLHHRDGVPASIPSLAANAGNWLLDAGARLYLYGTLLESAPYIKEDGRIQTWGLGLTAALNDLNASGWHRHSTPGR